MWQFDILTNKFVPGSLPANGKITACYTRLSQEDELDGDSGSILNQRDFLWKHCTENHFENIRFFSDDGYTGVNFERPSFAEMMKLVEQGYISTIIVKDHSRLGRNRLMVGLLMEQFTEDYNVRYIAVTDGIDSDKGFDDMVAVRELFNEFYPRDRKTLFGNVVKKCIQCSRTSEKRNNIVKKFKYSASYFELYTKFTPNEKDFRCGFQISYEP